MYAQKIKEGETEHNPASRYRNVVQAYLISESEF